MPSTEEEKIPTEADLNKLGAKIVKAEIMGDEVCCRQINYISEFLNFITTAFYN